MKYKGVTLHMIKKSFDQVNQTIGKYLTDMGFAQIENAVDNDGVYKAIYKDNNKAFSLSFKPEDKKFFLDMANVKDDSVGDFKNISIWLFDPENDEPKELRSVSNEFQETISDAIKGKTKINVQRDDVRAPKNVKVNCEAFCQNAVEIFPAFSEIYDANIEHYGKLNPDEFAKDSLGKHMLEMLSMKKNAHLKKLFEFLNTSFDKGDDDVQSIIVVTLFEMLLDNEEYEQLAEKYMSDSIKPIWAQVKKILLKKRK